MVVGIFAECCSASSWIPSSSKGIAVSGKTPPQIDDDLDAKLYHLDV
jgi:hypothetical protein